MSRFNSILVRLEIETGSANKSANASDGSFNSILVRLEIETQLRGLKTMITLLQF